MTRAAVGVGKERERERKGKGKHNQIEKHLWHNDTEERKQTSTQNFIGLNVKSLIFKP